MRQHVANFANFICRFGPKKALLDYAEEIVLPAFTDDTLIRKYGRTHYFFYNVKISVENKNSEEPTIIVYGQFIKNTTLIREQIFDEDEGLLLDEAAISSAPSAFFVLILNNHRLIFFPETAHAPTLKNFQTTVDSFLNKKYTAFIDGEYERARSSSDKVTKKYLRESHPAPSLEVIAISGNEQIEDFVHRYAILKKIEFRVIRPNDEIDGAELFDDIRKFLNPMQPSDTKLITSNTDGLDIDAAIPGIKQATDSGNQEIKLTGYDHDGNELKGDNNEFKVGAPIDTIPATKRRLAKKLLKVFRSLEQDGIINTGGRENSVKRKIVRLLKTL